MEDVFRETSYGKVALRKIKPAGPNFILYCAGWMGQQSTDRDCMEVTGAVFREALSGPRKGEICIMVRGSQRTVYVTASEMEAQQKEDDEAERREHSRNT